jgi:hypothetical protein
MHDFGPQLVLSSSADESTTFLSTLRQFVPLAVILGVLLDVVLGSPVANSVLQPIKKEAFDKLNSDGGLQGEPKKAKDTKELVDSEAVAVAALERAASVVELRAYLESNKSDADRIRDFQNQIDRDMQLFDKKQGPLLSNNEDK